MRFLASPLPAGALHGTTVGGAGSSGYSFAGIVAGPGLDPVEPNSLLTKAVKIQDSPTGVNIIVEQHRVTKFRVTVSAQGLELYFAPQIIGFDYQAVPGGAKVKIQATGDLNYRTTRLQNPDRLVVDFQDTLLVSNRQY